MTTADIFDRYAATQAAYEAETDEERAAILLQELYRLDALIDAAANRD